MSNDDFLYVFVHVPKCAGVTFRTHIVNNLKIDEHLLLDDYLKKLDKDRLTVNYKNCWEAASKYLSKLGSDEKSKIKIIYGHWVPYGVHKFFEKPARYFTFLRDPVRRTVSLYNYKTDLYERALSKGNLSGFKEKEYLVGGKKLSFEEWFDRYYNPKLEYGFITMFGYLRKLGYVEGDRLDERAMDSFLRRCILLG